MTKRQTRRAIAISATTVYLCVTCGHQRAERNSACPFCGNVGGIGREKHVASRRTKKTGGGPSTGLDN